MKLYKKTTLLEVVTEGPIHSLVKEQGPNKRTFLMPTQDLLDMYEEVGKREKQDRQLIHAILNG